MKYVKDTIDSNPQSRRWYNDACGTAFALELVGERWSLLIMRELLFGPRRFGELRASLSGITAKVLTERLEGMVAAGIVRHHKLPPPASVQVYGLTEWGYQSERAIQELGRWATRSPDHDPTLPFSAASLMLSFRTMFSHERAQGWAGTIGFQLGEEGFVVRYNAQGIAITREAPDGAEAIFLSSPAVLAAVIYAGRPLKEAEADGSVRIAGDRDAAERYITLFPLPPKMT
jgi:DNA-binding HxlR family transcriptional regulator